MARKPDFAVVSCSHDMHRLALLIRSCARSSCLFYFKKKASYPTQYCLAKALAWMTKIGTRIRVSQRIMKTPARLLTGHVKNPRHFLKMKNVVGEKLILPSFEKNILWET